MSRAVIILNTTFDRRRASDWVAAAKDGTRIEFKGPKRTLPQNDRMWAMLTDISSQVKWHGVRLLPDDWKLLFMAAMKRELRIVPNLDGTGFVNIGQSSSDLSVAEMSDLMELISAFGSAHGVIFIESSASSPADAGSGVVTGSSPDAAASHSDDAHPASLEQAPAAAPPPNAAGADLTDFARRIVSCIGDDWHVVRDMGVDLPKMLGITGDDMERANAISRVAIRACGNWNKPDGLPVEDALDLIAAHAGCAVKDLRP